MMMRSKTDHVRRLRLLIMAFLFTPVHAIIIEMCSPQDRSSQEFFFHFANTNSNRGVQTLEIQRNTMKNPFRRRLQSRRGTSTAPKETRCGRNQENKKQETPLLIFANKYIRPGLPYRVPCALHVRRSVRADLGQTNRGGRGRGDKAPDPRRFTPWFSPSRVLFPWLYTRCCGWCLSYCWFFGEHPATCQDLDYSSFPPFLTPSKAASNVSVVAGQLRAV